MRWRLTIWFSALLAITLVLLASIVFFVLRSRLYTEFDDQLLDQATLTQASIEVQNGVPVFNATVDHTGDFFRRLFDAKGRIRSDNSADFGGVPLDQPSVARRRWREKRSIRPSRAWPFRPISQIRLTRATNPNPPRTSCGS